MALDWDGVFSNPIFKHVVHPKDRDEKHPHHLPDHIEVRYITELTDEEIEEHDEDPESDFDIDELEQLGEGKYAWLVGHGWVADAGTYEFVMWADERPDPGTAKQLIVRYYS